MSKDRSGAESGRPGRRRGCLFRDALRTVEILLLIAYLSALALSRTAGFRVLAARRLEARLGGGAVEIGRSRLGPGGKLVLSDVRWKWPDAAGAEAVRIRELRIEPGWAGGPSARALQVDGLDIVLDREESGGVSPPFGAEVTLWLNELGWPVPELAARSAGAGPDFWSAFDRPLRLSRGSVRWRGFFDAGELRFDGIRGEIRPLRLDPSALRYVALRSETAGCRPARLLLAPDRFRIVADLGPGPD